MMGFMPYPIFVAACCSAIAVFWELVFIRRQGFKLWRAALTAGLSTAIIFMIGGVHS